MTRLAAAFLLLLGLSACGDPLRGIARVSDGAQLPSEPAAQALPSEDELAREGSILAGLFGGEVQAPAEGDVLPVEPSGEDVPDAATAPVETATGEDELGETDALAPESVQGNAEDAVSAPVKSQGGLLGWLRQAAQSEAADTAQPRPASLAVDASETESGAAALPVTASADLVEPEKRRGLFGAPRAQARRGPDAVDVAPGMMVPFGEIARNCEAKPAQLGKVVDKAARKGRGYVLYDTQPEGTQPRTFYVTGFSDNCPRQFTAALALFGEPAFHEQLRYGLPAEEYPYSTTDEAYEKLKRRVCNVGRNTPCGDRIDRLSRNTTFISAYERFTDNGRWADMLLHDGAVLAAALKTP